jgi:hypothetical protein
MLVVADLGGWIALANGGQREPSHHQFLNIFPTWNWPSRRSSSNSRLPVVFEVMAPMVAGVGVEQECVAATRIETARVQI